ncbi:phage holin [Ornithinibacillus bavariensis]|uniref:Holin n=1 Tax=Ornithinibacillus bavariensis TaxID=545502 RepID=A0A920C6R8_9BACI|nr:phage holin [Ornithinibacillus bavariensis]GIO25962.1 holin [Ornithinibacillus bavariensis]HAM80388.1 phage holin [Ornithinibacillus sp.]
MDKGTVVRTSILFVAIINQILVIFGKSPLPIDSELLEQVVSSLFTIITALITWFKNNYITKRGIEQRDALREKGLIKTKERKQK